MGTVVAGGMLVTGLATEIYRWKKAKSIKKKLDKMNKKRKNIAKIYDKKINVERKIPMNKEKKLM